MRLLIVTQKVDREDDLLGFFHQWIAEFAKHCESVTVICLERGVYELPANVRVLSLGKECCGKLEERTGLAEQGPSLRKFSTASRFSNKAKYLFNFYKYIWRERKNYDATFVHMNTEYMVLAGWLWRLMGKKVALWHVHFEVNWRLWVAEKFAHIIFTTTPDGCRVKSNKVRPIGHGIDVEKFKVQSSKLKVQANEPIRFLYAGKITPIKNVHVLVDAARILSASGGKNSWDKKFVVDIVGPPTDPIYDAKLRAYIAEKKLADVVVMHGRVPYSEMPAYYAHTDAVVNMCPTGGMDKTVLEGLAARTLAVVANTAFRELFGEYADALIYPYQDAEALAEKIKLLFSKSDEELVRMREFLHERMKVHSSLETRIPIVVHTFHGLYEETKRKIINWNIIFSTIVIVLSFFLYLTSSRIDINRDYHNYLSRRLDSFISKNDIINEFSKRNMGVSDDLLQQWAAYFLELRDGYYPKDDEYPFVSTIDERNELLATDPGIIEKKNNERTQIRFNILVLSLLEKLLFFILIILQVVISINSMRLVCYGKISNTQ